MVVNFQDRFQVSDEQVISYDTFSIPLSNQFACCTGMVPFPGQDILYIHTSYEVCAVDYRTKKVLATQNIPSNYNGLTLYPVMNAGKAELFVGTQTFLYCYDARTLELKYTMTIYPGMREFFVKDDRLYTLSYGYTIKTYDLNTKMVLLEKTIPYKGGKQAVNMFYAEGTNRIYLKYYTQYLHSQSGYYVNRNYLYYMNMVNGLPGDSGYVSIPELNKDTLTYADYGRIMVSPCGKYVTCNRDGDVYAIPENQIYSVRSGVIPDPVTTFSKDWKHVLTRSNAGNYWNMVPYALPGFLKGTALKSPNVMTPNRTSEIDFYDNDSLISCNISNIIVNIFINRIP